MDELGNLLPPPHPESFHGISVLVPSHGGNTLLLKPAVIPP